MILRGLCTRELEDSCPIFTDEWSSAIDLVLLCLLSSNLLRPSDVILAKERWLTVISSPLPVNSP